MPSEKMRDDLVNLADFVREIRKVRENAGQWVKGPAQLDIMEKAFHEAFSDFFNAHREEIFANATVVEAEEGLIPMAPRSMYISCSCGPVEESCNECGPEHFSYFFVSEDADLFRVRMEKP